MSARYLHRCFAFLLPALSCNLGGLAFAHETTSFAEAEVSSNLPAASTRPRRRVLEGYIQLEEPCVVTGYPHGRCLRLWTDRANLPGGNLKYIKRADLDMHLDAGFIVTDPDAHPATHFTLLYEDAANNAHAIDLVTHWHVSMTLTLDASGTTITDITHVKLTSPPAEHAVQRRSMPQPAVPQPLP